MLLHLIRHAEAEGANGDGGDPDPSLSPTGILQARLLPAALRECPSPRLLTSPARRARETADILSTGLGGVPVTQSEWARDRTPFPTADDEAYPAHAREWLHSCPAEERDLGARGLQDALHALLDLSGQQHVAVVTHAFVVAWMAARVLGSSTSAWLRMPVDNASVTTLGRNAAGEVVLHRFNWTPSPGTNGANGQSLGSAEPAGRRARRVQEPT